MGSISNVECLALKYCRDFFLYSPPTKTTPECHGAFQLALKNVLGQSTEASSSFFLMPRLQTSTIDSHLQPSQETKS
jgi:hypothetical protein